jgi:7-cyano-7-deazaguanine reductase
MTTDASNLTQLGQSVASPTSPETAVLERVPNPQPDTLYTVRFTAPEFTSLCPVTGQPDFAHLVIDYAPKDWLVESKSLKLYLHSFRNHGAFHEDCTVAIAKKFVAAAQPIWLRIGGYWYSDRRVLPDRPCARRPVAARPGRAELSRPRLIPHTLDRPSHP